MLGFQETPGGGDGGKPVEAVDLVGEDSEVRMRVSVGCFLNESNYKTRSNTFLRRQMGQLDF